MESTNSVVTSLFSAYMLFCIGNDMLADDELEVKPYEGQVLQQVLSEDSNSIKHVVEFYPKEIVFGDVGFIGSFDENVSDNAIPLVSNDASSKWGIVKHCQVSIKTNYSTEPYCWDNKTGDETIYAHSIICGESLGTKVLPNGRYYTEVSELGFPPLQDFDSPFWKELKDRLTPEGLECEISYKYEYYDIRCEKRSEEAVFKVLIKPRAENELELLEQWRLRMEETSRELDSRVFINPYFRKQYNLNDNKVRDSEKDWLTLKKNKIAPWAYTRFFNKKPGDPNCPTTISGWRDLESKFGPSVIHDDIRFTRLLLEYLDSEGGEEEEKTRSAVWDWFNALPDVQRAVIMSNRIGIGRHIRETSFNDKFFVLRRDYLKENNVQKSSE